MVTNNKRTLVAFIGSDNEETYINSFLYSIEHNDVDELLFINLLESSLNLEININKFIEKLQLKVSKLMEKKYKGETLEMDDYHLNLYKKLHDILLESKKIKKVNYNFFKSDFLNSVSDIKKELVIDVTFLPKRLGIDIFINLLSIGYRRVLLCEIKNIKLIDREIPMLYHIIKNNYEGIFLSSEEQFSRSIQYFVAQQNKGKFIVSAIAILLSSLVLFYQLVLTKQFTLGIVMLFLTILGGILPLIDFIYSFSSFKFRDK